MNVSDKNIQVIQTLIQKYGTREAAKKLIDFFLASLASGIGSSDLADTVTFADGLDTIEEYLQSEAWGPAFQTAKETAEEMLGEEGFGDNMFGESEKKQKPVLRITMKELRTLVKEMIKESQLPTKKYKVRVKHDKGTVNITTTATSEAAAKAAVMKAEGCPANAIISAKEIGAVVKENVGGNNQLIDIVSHALDTTFLDYVLRKTFKMVPTETGYDAEFILAIPKGSDVLLGLTDPNEIKEFMKSEFGVGSNSGPGQSYDKKNYLVKEKGNNILIHVDITSGLDI